VRRIICLTGLVLAVAAPAAGARPAPLDSPPPGQSVTTGQPGAPAPKVTSSSSTTGDDGLSTGWIAVLVSGGAAVAAGVGFAGGRRQSHHHAPARG
jgi:hypothetical protein